MERGLRNEQIRVIAAAAVLGLAADVVLAQAPDEPEVRRAIPVAVPTASPAATPVPIRRAEPARPLPSPDRNPPWMDQLPSGTRKAGATATPAPPRPAATPTPTPQERAVAPVRQPSVAPSQPTPTPGTVVPAATPPAEEDEPGSIRFAPGVARSASGGEPATLLAGDGFYGRKMYDLAVIEYERFLISDFRSPDRARALFRLAESQRFLGNDHAARAGYERLLSEFTEGEFVGAGAYRLGEILFAEKRYSIALPLFRTAAANAKEKAVKVSARFYQASCLELAGRKQDAIAIYREIADLQDENPYREAVLFKIAEADAAAGRKKEALVAFERLSREAGTAEAKAEATVKAGALAAELGNLDRAKELFDKAVAIPEIGRWRGVAAVGRLRLAYQAGDFERVSETAPKLLSDLPQDAMPEVLFYLGNAHRQLGKNKDALEVYDRIRREHPKSSAARDAEFQRLICLSALGNADTVGEIDGFLATTSRPHERTQAILLKAETLFQTGKFKDAADCYSIVVDADSLPAKFREQALFKLGWSHAQVGDGDAAVAALSKFIDSYPKSALLSAAYMQRARSHQMRKAYDNALKDFNVVLERHPKAREREAAIQQKALVLGQQEKYGEMAAAFEQLLSEYPDSKAAAQANFWIGWAAFETKDYARAVERLKKARQLGKKEFGERATLRIVLAYYYQQDSANLAKELAAYDLRNVPSETLVWLGMKYFSEGDFEKAEKFLEPGTQQAASVEPAPETLVSLARSRIELKKFKEAMAPINRYLHGAHDPGSRARGLLVSAEAALGMGNVEDANTQIEEVLQLQPEGPFNAEGRILGGDLQMVRKDYEAAARAYSTVAVLFDDPSITPRALRRAAEAFRRAGNNAEAERAARELQERYPDKVDPGPSAQAKAG